MDNITHSLVGATLAELALPAGATRAQRRLFFAAGIVAANLPDADFVYTWITPPPLGGLLHHRGHTHTIAGLAAQVLLLGALCLLPAIRRHAGAVRTRLGALIAVALVSHLILDSWNSYGVHPFWPFDSRWIYGDAIYIAEPWLWLLLGIAAALNMENRWGRVALAAMLAVPVALATWFRIVPVGVTAALAAGAMAWSMLARRWRPRKRSGIALALGALFVVTMFALRFRVNARALASLDVASRDEIVDVVLSPQPGNPLCWSVLSVATQEQRAEYATARASATPFGLSGCGPGRTQGVVWEAPVAHSLPQLRELHARNCWVRGWLQFGRVPEVARGSIGDLRYGASDANFTSMQLRSGEAAARCPPHLTSWGVPRADLLGPTND